ncbi:MAG TPA: universal stress protein [Hyphomicrobium sp.]|nr:universal stress protein [Hyphomicrobium sp.]
MSKKVLVANDGSEGAARAFSAALAIAAREGVPLHMICVEELPNFPASIEEVVEEQMDAGHVYEGVVARARAQAQAKGIGLVVHVVAGHAVPTICEFVQREGFDLLVVGYMGHSALYNRLIGGTTDRLVEHAPCNVLVIK